MNGLTYFRKKNQCTYYNANTVLCKITLVSLSKEEIKYFLVDKVYLSIWHRFFTFMCQIYLHIFWHSSDKVVCDDDSLLNCIW